MRCVVAGLGASMAFLGVSLAASQEEEKQPPKPPEAAASGVPQAGRVELPALLDSWYKIVQADQHVGYRHERLERRGIPGPSRFDYTAVEEAEFEVPDPMDPDRRLFSTISISSKAKLDDTYAPTDMNMVLKINGVEVIVNILLTEEGRRIEFLLPDGARRDFPTVAEEDIYYGMSLMFLALRQNEMLTRREQMKARLFSPRMDGAPVVEVAFDVGGTFQREYMGKKSTVTKVTWLKVPFQRNFEGQEAFVDRFGRMVELSTRGGVRAFLVQGEAEAMLQETNIRVAGRKDPFRKDLAMRVKQTGPMRSVPGGSSKVAVTKAEEGVKLAEKHLAELQRAQEGNDTEESKKQYNIIVGLYVLVRELLDKDPKREELRPKIEIVRTKAEDIYGGRAKVLNQARRMYLEAMNHFQYERCAEMERSIGDMRKLVDDPVFAGSDEVAKVRELFLELEPRLLKCKTRVELARKKLEISGIISQFEEKPQRLELPLAVFGHRIGSSHDLRFIQATQFAIINDKPYRVGETVEGEGVRVEKIWRHGIQVSLREELRDVSIRQ